MELDDDALREYNGEWLPDTKEWVCLLSAAIWIEHVERDGWLEGLISYGEKNKYS